MTAAPVERSPEGKAIRLCVGCAQTDDHPRHGIYLGADQVAYWHMDCHVLVTGCETCESQLEKCDTSPEPDGVVGDALQRRLIALNPNLEG